MSSEPTPASPSTATASPTRSSFDFNTDAGEYKKKTSAIPLLTAIFHDARTGSSSAAAHPASPSRVLYRVGMKTYGRLTTTPGGARQGLTVQPIQRVWIERLEGQQEDEEAAPAPQPQQEAAEDTNTEAAEAETAVDLAAADLSTEEDEPSVEPKGASAASRTRKRPKAREITWPEGYDPDEVHVRPEQIERLVKGQVAEEDKEGQPAGRGEESGQRLASGACDFLVCLEASGVQSTLVRPVEWAHNQHSSFILLREPGVYRLSYPSYYALQSLQWSLINSFTSTLPTYTPPAPRAKVQRTAEALDNGEVQSRRLKEAEKKAKREELLARLPESSGRPQRETIRAKQEEMKRKEEEEKFLKEERRIARGKSGKRRRQEVDAEDDDQQQPSGLEAPPSPQRETPPSSSRAAHAGLPPPLLLSSAPKRKSSVLPHHCYGFDWRVVCRVVECVYAHLHSSRSSTIRWPQVAELMQPTAAVTPAECRRLWRFAAYTMDETGHSNHKRLDIHAQHSSHRKEDDEDDDEVSDIDADMPAGVVYVGHEHILAAARHKPRVEERHSAHGWSTEADHALIHTLHLWADKRRTAEAAASASCSPAFAAPALLVPSLPTPFSSQPSSSPPTASSSLSSFSLSLRYLPSSQAEWDVVSALFRHFAGVDKSGAFLFSRFALLARSALTTDVGEEGSRIDLQQRLARERLLQALQAPNRDEALHGGGRNWESSRRIDDRRVRRRKRERRESSKHPRQEHSAGRAVEHKEEEEAGGEVEREQRKRAEADPAGTDATSVATEEKGKEGSSAASGDGMDVDRDVLGEKLSSAHSAPTPLAVSVAEPAVLQADFSLPSTQDSSPSAVASGKAPSSAAVDEGEVLTEA